MQTRHHFVQMLRQHIHFVLVIRAAHEQLDLTQHLVGEAVAHHEARVASGAAQVHQAAFGQQDDAFAVWEFDVVYLWFDVVPHIAAQAGDFDFAVEVANVAHNRLVAHGFHVVVGNHVHVACGGDKNVGFASHIVHAHHAVAFHSGL